MTSTDHAPDRRPLRVAQRAVVRAPVERVWQAWTEPVELSRWFTDDARGSAEPGDTLVWVWSDFDLEVAQRVVDAKPPERLVLEGRDPSGRVQRLEVTLRPSGRATELEVVQSGFPEGSGPDDPMVQAVDSGWTLGLAILGHYVERHFGRDCRRFFLGRTVGGDGARIPRHFRDEEALATWLTRSGGLGATGQAFRLELHNGETVTGRVLARSNSEVALSWNELGAALELKRFPGPAGAVAAVRLSSWTASEAEVEAARRILAAALDRLADALAPSSGPR